MIATINIYEGDIIYENIEIEVKYEIYNDGIGAYEYWGAKCYDMGHERCDIDDIKLIKKDEYTEEDVKYIENYIKEHEEKFEDTITNQIFQHIENETQYRAENIAEERYYRAKYGDSN